MKLDKCLLIWSKEISILIFKQELKGFFLKKLLLLLKIYGVY